MLKAIFQTSIGTISTVLLLIIAVSFLTIAGMQPLWAVIGILVVRGIIRFIFRIVVMLISTAIVIGMAIWLLLLLF